MTNDILKKTITEVRNAQMDYRLNNGSIIHVLDKFDLSISTGEIVALLGPSGSGKSTALKILTGLLKPTNGQGFFNNKPLSNVNTDLGVVFQDVALYPWLTVAENIEFGLYPKGYDLRTRRQRVHKAIDSFGLEGFEEAYPRELSGGMRQRVGIARALALNPKLMCMDEPFSSLDVMTAETLRGEMLDIWQNKSTTLQSILLITHDIAEAVYMATRIIVIGAIPNSIKANIQNDLPFPRNQQSWQFDQLVKRIHSVITESMLSDKPPTSHADEQSLWIIPPVHVSEVIGLTELIEDHQGILDVFELPELIAKDFGEALTIVKAAELMGFVDTPQQRVVITKLGRHIAHGDVNQRKESIRQQLKSLRLVKMLIELLQNEEQASLPYDKVIEWLHSKSPALNPQRSLDTLIDWGRYGGLFRFTSDTATLYLDEDTPLI